MGIEQPQQNEADPRIGFERATASFKENISALNAFIESHGGEVPEEARAAYEELKEKILKPYAV
ncbi:MAG: hypothetical protein WC217_02045 [Candidatus Paceibacterota bacterium]|jgi:hypothetical protein